MFNTSKWFPHWNDEDIEACAFKLKPGTNKMKRIVQIKVKFIFFTIIHEIKLILILILEVTILKRNISTRKQNIIFTCSSLCSKI